MLTLTLSLSHRGRGRGNPRKEAQQIQQPEKRVSPSLARREPEGEGALRLAVKGKVSRRPQTAMARRFRRNQTDAEGLVWSMLRSKQVDGLKFRRQEAIGPYIVDFVSFEKSLIIEIDGGQHGESRGRRQDEARSMWLRQQGYQVLRFWNNDVLLSREAVAETIRAALELGNAPSPQPSPIKGEGAKTKRYRKNSEWTRGCSPSPGGRELEGGGT